MRSAIETSALLPIGQQMLSSKDRQQALFLGWACACAKQSLEFDFFG